jgi:NADH dehydrogenase
VVGGGATGVETAGAVAELLKAELREDYPDLPVSAAQVHLFELGAQVLGPFKPNLQNYAKSALEKRGVELHFGEGVVKVEPTRVHLKSGAVMKAHTLVWAAGLGPNPLVESLATDGTHGRPEAGPDLSLAGRPEVFAVGDLALIHDTKTGDALPQLGSVALQAGDHAGKNIERLVRGKQAEPFVYTDKGTMATVGRGAAVVEFKRGRTMTGRAAYVAWLGVHLTLLSGGEQKGLTALDWGWNALGNGKKKRLIVK